MEQANQNSKLAVVAVRRTVRCHSASESSQQLHFIANKMTSTYRQPVNTANTSLLDTPRCLLGSYLRHTVHSFFKQVQLE